MVLFQVFTVPGLYGFNRLMVVDLFMVVGLNGFQS
jgi:hypothetical protein